MIKDSNDKAMLTIAILWMVAENDPFSFLVIRRDMKMGKFKAANLDAQFHIYR